MSLDLRISLFEIYRVNDSRHFIFLCRYVLVEISFLSIKKEGLTYVSLGAAAVKDLFQTKDSEDVLTLSTIRGNSGNTFKSYLYPCIPGSVTGSTFLDATTEALSMEVSQTQSIFPKNATLYAGHVKNCSTEHCSIYLAQNIATYNLPAKLTFVRRVFARRP